MSKQALSHLKKAIAPYESSDIKSSVRQLFNTILPFILLWFLAYESLSVSIWLSFLFSIVAAGFVVRIFIIFHDCCHGSFFQNKKANKIVGNVTGVITLFPFEKWRREHSIHHSTSSNLNKRGIGDVWIMTVDEYVAASWKLRLQYRIYRNPLVMFGLGPLYLFLVSNRLNSKDARKNEKWNTYATNVAIVGIYSLLVWMIGWKAFVIVQAPILFVAGLLGIWLFYVQHQFEDSYFEDETEWDYVKAAIDGSSYYQLPKVLQWVTGNIGYHHVHHLSPRIPNYHLEKVHESTPPLQQATTITVSSSLKSVRFRLYDENKKTFVTFKDVQPLIEKAKMLARVENGRAS